MKYLQNTSIENVNYIRAAFYCLKDSTTVVKCEVQLLTECVVQKDLREVKLIISFWREF